MIVALGYGLMACACIVGGLKARLGSFPATILPVVRTYSYLLLFLAGLFVTIAVTNAVPLPLPVAQFLMFGGVFIWMFTGLAFGALFTLLLGGHRTLGYVMFGVLIAIGMFYFLVHVWTAAPAFVMNPDTVFQYVNPNFTKSGLAAAIVSVVAVALLFGLSMMRTALLSDAPGVKFRGLMMSWGAVLASASGMGYFGGHLFAGDLLPNILIITTPPGVVGFWMMAIPLIEPMRKTVPEVSRSSGT